MGSSQFVIRLRSEQLAKATCTPRGESRDVTLAQLARAVAQRMLLSGAELCSGAKRREVVAGRAMLSFRTVKEAGLRTAAVAIALNVTARAVARVLPPGARLATKRDCSLATLRIDVVPNCRRLRRRADQRKKLTRRGKRAALQVHAQLVEPASAREAGRPCLHHEERDARARVLRIGIRLGSDGWPVQKQ